MIKFNVKPNLKILGQKYGKDLQIIRKFINDISSEKLLIELQNTGELKIDSDSTSLILNREDLLIESESVEGFTSGSDDGITVGIHIELNEELIQEGIVRDLIRQVQMMRKEAGFAVEDRIKIFGEVGDNCGIALEKFKDYFFNETLTVNWDKKINSGEYQTTFKLRDEEITLGIQRFKNGEE